MSNSTTTLHQLYLFFVYFKYCTIGIGFAIYTDNKTVGQ